MSVMVMNLSSWRHLYEAAVLETNTSQLPRKIWEAEAAIRERLEALDGRPKHGEAHELESALDALAALRMERLPEDTDR